MALAFTFRGSGFGIGVTRASIEAMRGLRGTYHARLRASEGLHVNRQGDNYNPEDEEAARRERPNEGDDAFEGSPQETIIDVSGDQPEVLEREPAPGMFFGRQSSEVRVWVTQSGPRGCLIPIAVVLLLICCSCVGIWVLFDNIF